MIKKKCAVCGKEIEVASSFYCLCSDECRKARRKLYNEEYYEKRKQERIQSYTVIPCRICGKPVPPTFHENKISRSHYHEKCVLSEALQAVRDGCGWKDKRIMRAWNTYGYTKSELLEELDNYD